MKIIITESHIKNALFKYFDKEKAKGNPVKVDSNLFQLFRLPYYDDSLYEYLIEYNGGMENAINKTKELISKLPNNIPFNSQLDGELFFGIWDSKMNDWNELELSVDVSGELNNAQFWDDDLEEYVYRDASLSEFYSELDMPDGPDIQDMIVNDIKDYLMDNITKYTGIQIEIEEFKVID
jgi:DNA-binding protein Fis